MNSFYDCMAIDLKKLCRLISIFLLISVQNFAQHTAHTETLKLTPDREELLFKLITRLAVTCPHQFTAHCMGSMILTMTFDQNGHISQLEWGASTHSRADTSTENFFPQAYLIDSPFVDHEIRNILLLLSDTRLSDTQLHYPFVICLSED